MENYRKSEHYQNLQKRVNEAYEMGEKYKKLSIYQLLMNGLLPEWLSSFSNDLYSVAFEAGQKGKEKPKLVKGWRYGDIPIGGKSKNFREDKYEYGTSMMEIEDENGKHQTGIPEMEVFFKNEKRPKKNLFGWLNTIQKGGDEEPLLLFPQYQEEEEKKSIKKKKTREESIGFTP